MNSTKQSNPLINIAVIAGVLGGLSAVVALHPKGKQVKEHFLSVGDDFAHAVERTIDKVHEKQHPDEPLDISQFVSTVLTELENLDQAAKIEISEKKPLRERVEEKIVESEDSLETLAHWFQQKGKALARKGLKEY